MSPTTKEMKITIINSERNEKRYTRVKLEDFVTQLRDGTYSQHYVLGKRLSYVDALDGGTVAGQRSPVWQRHRTPAHRSAG